MDLHATAVAVHSAFTSVPALLDAKKMSEAKHTTAWHYQGGGAIEQFEPAARLSEKTTNATAIHKANGYPGSTANLVVAGPGDKLNRGSELTCAETS
jgi:hypothetical protein